MMFRGCLAASTIHFHPVSCSGQRGRKVENSNEILNRASRSRHCCDLIDHVSVDGIPKSGTRMRLQQVSKFDVHDPILLRGLLLNKLCVVGVFRLDGRWAHRWG